MHRVAIGTLLALSVLAGRPALGTEQTVLGAKFVVRNPGNVPSKRKVSGLGKESSSPNTVVGDPTSAGASLRVIANGGTDSDQTFSLPAAGWRPVGTLGFKYSNGTTGGAAKSALIKRTTSGVFSVKMSIKGSFGPVSVVPPNPGDDGGFILTINGGDSYCVAFGGAAGGVEQKDDAETWSVKKATGEACPAPSATATTTTTTATTSTMAGGSSTTTTATTSTTIPGCDCCSSSALPALLSFITAASGCGTDPPGSVTPARCVQDTVGGTNGTVCTTDTTCGNGFCRGHLDCTGLYFGGGQPSGLNLPAVVPDLGLSFSKISSCSSGNPDMSPTTAADVPAGCSTPAGTPTYGQRHCTSPGCLFGAPLAIPNPTSTATGTCVVNFIANRPGAGTGSAACGTGAVDNLTLPLDSQVYLTGPIEPTRVCSTCVGGTPGVCGSGTCGGGPRNGMPCTPETSALNGSYPTSHDCPPPNAPGGQLATCGSLPSGSFIGCLPVDFGLSTGVQTKNSFTTAAQARVFCGYCFDPTFTLAFENPPHPCTADAQCTNGNFTSCQQHSNGAFRNTFATTVSETGTAPDACIADGAEHPATLVSVFCVPPSYNGIVDPSGELPGPGAVSLPGTSQFISLATTTTVAGSTTTTVAGSTTTTTTASTTTTTALLPACGNLAPFVCNAGTCPPLMVCLSNLSGICGCM